MVVFKTKPNRARSQLDVGTLDGYHRKFVQQFQRRKTELPLKRIELGQLRTRLIKLDQKDTSQLTMGDIEGRSELRVRISRLEEEIDDIESGASEMEYYATVGETLSEYYDLIGADDPLPEIDVGVSESDIEIKSGPVKPQDQLDEISAWYRQKHRSKAKKPPKKRKKLSKYAGPSILDCLTGEPTPKETEEETTTDAPASEKPEKPEESKVNRATLYHQFRTLVDHEYVDPKSRVGIRQKCDDCGTEKMLIPQEGLSVCQTCGEFEYVMVDCDRSGCSDSGNDKPGYPYKRINHYNEWLAQFQAKENTVIPSKVYHAIHRELRKMRFYDFDNLSYQLIKRILKRLEMTDFYEHIPYIISKINNRPPPTISQKEENRLRDMFMEIQEPFQRHCPKDRVNFLSYSYVLHKQCQLLELDEFTKCFQLLKNRDKLRQQDKIWEKICEELKWEYIPSV